MKKTLVPLLALAVLVGCSFGRPNPKDIEYGTIPQADQPHALIVPPGMSDPNSDSRSATALPPAPAGTPATNNAPASQAQPSQGKEAPIGVLPPAPKRAPSSSIASVVEDGPLHFLEVKMPLDEMWTKVHDFWVNAQGMKLDSDNPTLGIMETEWKTARPKGDLGAVRNQLAKIFGNSYTNDMMDRFRTRLANTSDAQINRIYVTHQGMAQVYADERQSTTKWQWRPQDPELEIEMLRRLGVYLGGQEGWSVRPSGALVQEDQGLLLVGKPAQWTWAKLAVAFDRINMTVNKRDEGKYTYIVSKAAYTIKKKSTEFVGIGRDPDVEEDVPAIGPYMVTVVPQKDDRSQVKVALPDGKALSSSQRQSFLKTLADNLNR